MTEQPIPSHDQAANDVAAATSPGDAGQAASIVDTILDLDAVMSKDVRRAERVARIMVEPHLYGRLDELNNELRPLVDAQGVPLVKPRDSAAAGERDVAAVLADITSVEAQIERAHHNVYATKMTPSAWAAWEEKWLGQIQEGRWTPAMRRELVVDSPTRPEIDGRAYDRIESQFGTPAVQRIADAAYAANAHSGVDVGKSQLASVVRRQLVLSQS